VSTCWLLDFFFFSSRRRHTRSKRDWSSDVCSSDLTEVVLHSLGEAMYVVDKDYIVRMMNPYAAELLGFKNPEEAIGKPLDEVVRSEERRVGKECRWRGWTCA